MFADAMTVLGLSLYGDSKAVTTAQQADGS